MRYTTLTAWFELNKADKFCNTLSYVDIVQHYIFFKGKWRKRKQNPKRPLLGRMYNVSPGAVERYHLRILLLHVRGATSFNYLKTVNSIILPSFKDLALCLISDDNTYVVTLQETVLWPFLHVSNHEYYGDNFISKPNPNSRYKVSIISHQYYGGWWYVKEQAVLYASPYVLLSFTVLATISGRSLFWFHSMWLLLIFCKQCCIITDPVHYKIPWQWYRCVWFPKLLTLTLFQNSYCW